MQHERDRSAERAVEPATRLPGGSDGSAPGYRANRTLPLRVELRRQLARGRTKLVLCCLAVLPLLLVGTFALGNDETTPRPPADFGDLATSSGANFTVFTLLLCTHLLLVLLVALFFGDAIAGESSWASLRYLVAIPVPRHRLLRQKALVAGLLSCLSLLVLTGAALATGTFWYGAGVLRTPHEGVFHSPWNVLVPLAICGYLAIHLTWVASLALLFSVMADNPLAAVGATVGVSVISQILDEIPRLEQFRILLPSHHATAWTDLLDTGIDWTDMANGTLSATAYAAVFITATLVRFHRADITN
ncbi:ABC-2 type transport system permease protein [Actinopolyspora lacussalsi subsp. righensis]|uniref:ABC-2 type transport system permease protein n=1 Tax=Actinopolyspora righensis TaxID=995060 RepID=A0A1I6ZQL6_9ACTN|nr:ABC transporter permease subunit [Actinopolyspora righensis]SFT65013.1 ABC-2 type transport system permease protein [Actinopolyspora righensis]